MKLNSTISFGFIFSLTVLSGENHNWNKWRGPDGNGNWNGPKIQKELPGTALIRIWQSKISPGYSGVTVCNGLVYTMDRPVNTASEENRESACPYGNVPNYGNFPTPADMKKWIIKRTEGIGNHP